MRGILTERIDRAIASDLGVSVHTVRTHLERLFRKLGVHSRTGVAVAVLEAYIATLQAPEAEDGEESPEGEES